MTAAKRPRRAAAARVRDEDEGLSASEVARLFGRHRNTVAGWIHAGAPAVEVANRREGQAWRLRVPEVLAWLLERAETAAVGRAERKWQGRVEALEAALAALREGAPADATMTEGEARRRKRVAEARLRELELDVREGRLGSVAEMGAAMASVMTQTRDHLLAVSTSIAPYLEEVAAAEAHRIVDNALRSALEQIADAKIVATAATDTGVRAAQEELKR